MATTLCRRPHFIMPHWLTANFSRALTTAAQASTPKSTVPPTLNPSETPEVLNTHFKITLRRSAISLGKKIQGTLLALGFHRRHQTVYHPHSPEIAGKILRVKELVEVQNVPSHLVLTAQQQRQARKATNGFAVVGSRRNGFMNV